MSDENTAPAPEPKCYHCETCRNQCSPKTGQPICCNCKRELAAPEPQGSEEPIGLPNASRLALANAARRESETIAALRAENEKLKAHALLFPADLITERDALRAQLAQAREERDKLQRLYTERCNEADDAYAIEAARAKEGEKR